MKQNEALSLLKMGKNIFLTGAAGAGKTYLLNQYIHYLKENNVDVAITASTGIAATHLQGMTVHAWSGIGIKDHLTKKDLEKLFDDKRIRRNYKKTKVLIIDEVSMLHAHQLDMVDTIARYILENNEPFGGIQVVLCGDFFQLPPVSSASTDIEKHFAFKSNVWKNQGFEVCYLEEQHRQDDDPLLTILNDIRNGATGEHTKVPLRTRYKKEPQGETKATKLYSRNINVDKINDAELEKLTTQEKTFTMLAEGFEKLVEGLKKSCLAQETLKLKIGAEVIFIKNDNQARYVNGTRCIVVGFEKSPDAWPIVKTYDGKIIIAAAESWKYQDNGYVRASLTQVPLRLAWAITIHKSQGMTLDAAEIDLGDAFEPGMGYVALSRVRSLSGLKLMNLNEIALTVHPIVLSQDKILKIDSANFAAYLQNLSDAEKITQQRKTLFERFEGSTEKKINKNTSRLKKGNETPTHLVTLQMLKETLSADAIAEKRGLTLGTIVTHIEKLVSLKEIDASSFLHLKNKLPKNEFEAILTELKQSEDGKLKPIYDKFSGKYSYTTIQMVRLFLT
ncbi:MAG: helix-turn-helix domain-containing protein [Pseudomonadota bacterium]